MEIKIIKTKDEIIRIVSLFEAYRSFYLQKPALERSKEFLLSHHNNKSHILIGAFELENIIGFTQLYPSFSSISLKKLYILNDLFVDPNVRNSGVGEALIKFAQELAIKHDWKGLILETNAENPAQKLYEKTGWKRDLDYYHYAWNVPS